MRIREQCWTLKRSPWLSNHSERLMVHQSCQTGGESAPLTAEWLQFVLQTGKQNTLLGLSGCLLRRALCRKFTDSQLREAI